MKPGAGCGAGWTLGAASPGGEFDVKVLFVCGKARMRSPTAADIAAQFDGIQADFAGLSKDADEVLTPEQIEWADAIYVMERRQKKRLTAKFSAHLAGKRLRSLDIPDKFAYMDARLVDLLRSKLAHLEG